MKITTKNKILLLYFKRELPELFPGGKNTKGQYYWGLPLIVFPDLGPTNVVTVHLPRQIVMFYCLAISDKGNKMDPVKRIWYLSPMRAAKVQASLRIRAVSPKPSMLAHTSSESRVTFKQKARSLAPLNGWACAVKIGHDGMLEDTNSLDGAHITNIYFMLCLFDLLVYNPVKLLKSCWALSVKLIPGQAS